MGKYQNSAQTLENMIVGCGPGDRCTRKGHQCKNIKPGVIDDGMTREVDGWVGMLSEFGAFGGRGPCHDDVVHYVWFSQGFEPLDGYVQKGDT